MNEKDIGREITLCMKMKMMLKFIIYMLVNVQ